MASELYNIIEGVSREKGIDPQIVVSAVEDAIVVATRKYYKTQENLRAVLDKDSGKISAYAVKSIVETPEQVEDPNLQVTVEQARKLDPAAEAGGELLIPKVTEGILGRIAAQLAKQVIFQKVREAERDTVYNEYIGHVNEIVNATVKRLEGPDVILDIGKAEARMGRKEQSRLESFAVGERIRVVIVRVEKAVKGPGVVASRSAPELVQHLFQTEVPEIYDGTVVIRAIAREAGERTKIAVMSKDKDVDAVGACVGMKGMRVQSIIRELRGEKIDIIEYHEDPVTFAEKALQPAKVSRVTVVDAADKHLEVVVDDTQLSLAIGKKGQNVRLAAKLLGWKIDIKSEEEKRQEVEQQMSALVTQTVTPLELVTGLGEGLVEKRLKALARKRWKKSVSRSIITLPRWMAARPWPPRRRKRREKPPKRESPKRRPLKRESAKNRSPKARSKRTRWPVKRLRKRLQPKPTRAPSPQLKTPRRNRLRVKKPQKTSRTEASASSELLPNRRRGLRQQRVRPAKVRSQTLDDAVWQTRLDMRA
jgi:N utilization substance protein A